MMQIFNTRADNIVRVCVCFYGQRQQRKEAFLYFFYKLDKGCQYGFLTEILSYTLDTILLLIFGSFNYKIVNPLSCGL